MWEGKIARAEAKIRRRMNNALVTFYPDDPAAYTIPAVYHSSHAEFKPTSEGAVTSCSFDPWVDVSQAVLTHIPKSREELNVEIQGEDGTYTEPIRFRVKDTQENGFRSIKLLLNKVIP